jgi:histidyl-tRNA synthetase
MIIQNVKGGYDFLPKEQRIRNYINGILKETFEEYGYQPIETPILCYFDMLAGKYDETNDILNEIYKLRDQGNRELGLRYDLTVPFAKFIALNKNEIKLPFKRYEINKVFRDGPVKVGRDREFTQCDVDVVGLSNQLIEAELMSLYVTAFNRLQIPINIKYNSRKLMSALILETGVKEDLVSPTITIIDKIDKLTEFELTNEFINIGLKKTQITKLLQYFKLDLKELNKLFKDTNNTLLKEGLEELNNLTKFLKELKILKYTTFTPSLARGQDYYTGNVFEVYETTGKLSGAIGGGGRYDKMITEFIDDGNIYPAVGISFGLTSIFALLANREDLNKKSDIDIYIIPMGTEIESLKLANSLRELGFKIELEMEQKKLKKSLDFCNKEEIPYVIILGTDEITNKEFKLKNMFNREEYLIKMDELDKIKDIVKKEV